jgi:hypothetical protein
MSGINRWQRAIAPCSVIASTILLSGCLSTSPSSDGRTTTPVKPSVSDAATPANPNPSPPAPDDEGGAADPQGRERAVVVLARLPVKGRAPMTGYDRARFGQAWLDADRNGCDTRNDVLGEHLTDVEYKPGTDDCVVNSGDLADPYTSLEIHFVKGDGFLVDVDHVVALANVWVTGGSGWDIKKRAAIANDRLNLEPVDASTNRQKGDGDAATWLPPNKSYRCAYVARQVAVKKKYRLWVTPPEEAAVRRVLAACPDERIPADSGAPTSVSLNIQDPHAQSAQDEHPDGSVYYTNCDAARAAGAAPVLRGDPGYGPHLDRDGDGSACE